MKIKIKLVHFYDNNQIIDQGIVQKYFYIQKNLCITEYIKDAYEFKSIEEYIKKTKKKYKSRFICVTKFSCFEIMKMNNEKTTYVYFVELIK